MSLIILNYTLISSERTQRELLPILKGLFDVAMKVDSFLPVEALLIRVTPTLFGILLGRKYLLTDFFGFVRLLGLVFCSIIMFWYTKEVVIPLAYHWNYH